MPLLTRGGQVIDPPAPSRTFTESDLRTPTATYIDPTGQQWPLTTPDLGWVTLDEVGGLGAVPVEIATDPHPRGGARIRHIQDQPRIINWPLLVWADSHQQFLTRWRTLTRAFKLTRRLGPGQLRITRPDGSDREIACTLQEGFQGEPGQGITHDTTVLALYCEDPYFRDTEPLSLLFTTPAPRRFLTGFPALSSGRVLGDTDIVNPGEGNAWPLWTLTGPSTSLTAINRTLGQSFVLTHRLDAGQAITITTDTPTVRGPSGEVLTAALNWPGAVLWGLDSGLNEVTFSVAGATAATAIALSFFPRFETA
ncbi:hypothetical protein [Krasilnikovia sp. MM14-A1259]|uniref:hypothetical protein n=1 Tax=Krasilnikovia sp. MM14-A1259 TaxID=3373539 RepID=UPI00380881DC